MEGLSSLTLPPRCGTEGESPRYAGVASAAGSSVSASMVPSPSTSFSGGSSPQRSVPAISSSPFGSAGMNPDFMPK